MVIGSQQGLDESCGKRCGMQEGREEEGCVCVWQRNEVWEEEEIWGRWGQEGTAQAGRLARELRRRRANSMMTGLLGKRLPAYLRWVGT